MFYININSGYVFVYFVIFYIIIISENFGKKANEGYQLDTFYLFPKFLLNSLILKCLNSTHIINCLNKLEKGLSVNDCDFIIVLIIFLYDAKPPKNNFSNERT